MGIFREVEDFFDETPRVVVPNPFSNVEVELPKEWAQVTSEQLSKKLRIKEVGKRATRGAMQERGSDRRPTEVSEYDSRML